LLNFLDTIRLKRNQSVSAVQLFGIVAKKGLQTSRALLAVATSESEATGDILLGPAALRTQPSNQKRT